MGAGSFSTKDWDTYRTSTVGKSTDAIFTTKGAAKSSLDPNGVVVRESRDSVDNPQSTAIIVGIDVTGSMGMIADTLAREGLGVLFTEILDRKPVTDPHLMFMAIGDAYADRNPLQVSQFEADNRIIPQLTDIYLEKGGGGNQFESYDLPWYFAAHHTSLDCFEKRAKKGYLFTVGDENPPPGITAAQITKIFGDSQAQGMSSAELLVMVQRTYHVFHLVVEEGDFCRHGSQPVIDKWRSLLGQNVLALSDYTKLSEVIVSAIQVIEGADKVAVASSWSGSTSLVVAKALSGMEIVPAGVKAKGVVRFNK
jgi:hypothetical protein